MEDFLASHIGKILNVKRIYTLQCDIEQCLMKQNQTKCRNEKEKWIEIDGGDWGELCIERDESPSKEDTSQFCFERVATSLILLFFQIYGFAVWIYHFFFPNIIKTKSILA